MTQIDYRDFDRDIWEKELEDFVPPDSLRHARPHVVGGA